MLKLVAGLVAGATLLTVGTVSAFAASQSHGLGDCTKTRVCDTANCSAQCYVDGDNDGMCDNRGQNYVDADNDGICDNQGTHCQGGNQGHHGNGYRGGHHR